MANVHALMLLDHAADLKWTLLRMLSFQPQAVKNANPEAPRKKAAN